MQEKLTNESITRIIRVIFITVSYYGRKENVFNPDS